MHNIRRWCAVIGVGAVLWLPSLARAQETLRGFTADGVAQELRYEQLVNGAPNAAAALRYEQALAGHVHRMGQPWDYRTAVYMRERFAAAGWDAKIVTYVVPIAWPTQQQLAIVAPTYRSIDMYEPALPGDPWSSEHAAIGIPYSGYATDGDVSGPLVYVYHGMPTDYRALARMHISVRGAVVLAEFGGGWSSRRKAGFAARHGVKAMLLYPEPFVDDYNPKSRGTPYPKGPYRPLGAALRNEMMVDEDAGDPTVDGAPLPGVKHKSMSLVKSVPIPFTNVTPLVAQQLLTALDGPKAPRTWRTNIAQHFSVAGRQRVRFVLKSRRFFGPIWDVIARLPGAVAPEESVVIGSHRDAWTYGAIDPGSGSTDLLLVADVFGKLYRTGWRPYRTLIIGSWDGEELNYFGSDAWVRQNESALKQSCWAYINTDEVTTGKRFEPYATDDLAGLVRSLSAVAIAPNGKTVSDYWIAQDKKRHVEPPGTGSDHEEFAYHENIPSVGYIYSGPFGTWHSAYDNVASLRVFDPGMRLAEGVARVTGITALRLADAPFPDVNALDLALGLQRRLNAFANAQHDEARRAVVVKTLQPYVRALIDRARATEAKLQAAAGQNQVTTLQALEKAQLASRSAFYSQKGIPGDRWHRSLLYHSDDNIGQLPSLDMTLDAKQGEAALQQLVAAFQRATGPVTSAATR